MRKTFCGLSLPLLLLTMTGCNAIGDKAGNLSLVYCITALLSLLVLISYCCIKGKKDPWFFLLFGSVLVVNISYYMLAVSADLSQALLANRIAYLGSVFLPLSMWMIILDVTNSRLPKWVSGLLLGVGVIVFLIAASPGYSTIYYQEVYFQKIDGVTVLQKVYGPLHGVYLIYLLGYFAAMVTTIIHATVKDKVESVAYAAILAVAVFVNIGVWLIEQLVRIDFEILSVSYIISESFLLGLHLFIIESDRKKAVPVQPLQEPPQAPPPDALSPEDAAQLELFIAGLPKLTPKEQDIYDRYILGMSTAQILEQLSIKENTLKFHNKNLYSKLGISSRKQLLRFAALMKSRDNATK